MIENILFSFGSFLIGCAVWRDWEISLVFTLGAILVKVSLL